MNKKKNLGLCTLIAALVAGGACGRKQEESKTDLREVQVRGQADNWHGIFPEGKTVKDRYEVPPHYRRVKTKEGSFEHFLQNLPLKATDYPTHLFDGREKEIKWFSSVVDLDMDSVDIRHSAGTIIRLRAEYLFRSKQYSKIHFTFTDGFSCDYLKWAAGFRIRFNGNKARWYKASDEEDFSYATFREYLREVFAHTDEKSLMTDMRLSDEDSFGIGTVIFSTEKPYHAAIVVDMLEREDGQYDGIYTPEVVLLARGGNPAQEIEIIKGNGDELGLLGSQINPPKYPPSALWITQNKGERNIKRQGGRLLIPYGPDFYNKKNYNFE